ncbi:hypothetical protein CK203_044070 [Vitis vinifera]|uniref:Uncharacterized protein n=1 Tax=Vitis vinifera TaxID=29760 RepID=A0A438HLZ9_VITVI|nr:hypothetical protein CK203_044070 [Vitis vinifera]
MKKAMMATWSESEESSEEENEKEVANMCFMAINDLDEGSKKDKWFLDSGCSRHMTRDESKFAFLTKRKGGYVTFGDNSKGRIIGQGNIGLETSMGKLQIEDRRQQEEVVEDHEKENHLWHYLLLNKCKVNQAKTSLKIGKFSKCMHSEFEMSMMGQLNFFLGLQIKQLKEGTFINQAKYIRDLLKRFNMEEAKTMKTPMSSSIRLDMDEKGKPVNSTMYRGMIGLWYPKGDNFELIGYSDADFAGCKVERKNTSGTCHFLGHSLVSWHSKKQNSVALFTAETECIAVVRWMAPRREMNTFRAQGKCLAKPFHPEQTEARRKARYDTTLFNGMAASHDDFRADLPDSVGLRVYEAKTWPTVPGFEPREAV